MLEERNTRPQNSKEGLPVKTSTDRENVIAGRDCGFATFAAFVPVDPKITWAKLAAMTEGTRLASQQLWKATT